MLIVEDEAVTRRILSRLLSSCGFNTTSTGSAEEALEVLRSGAAPEFAVVDMDLPGMNGIELIRHLETLGPKVFPVLVTAADGDRVSRGLNGLTVPYFQKPLEFDRLLVLLNQRQKWA